MSEVIDQEKNIDPADVPMRPTAIRYGGMMAMALILIGLIFTLTGLSDPAAPEKVGNKIQQWIGYLAMIAAVILAIKHHRDNELGGYIKYGRALGLGTLTGLVMGVINAVWMLIYMYVIDPDLQGKIKEMAIQQATENGATEEVLEQTAKMMDIFTNPLFMSIGILLATVFMAFIFSLVISAIMKKDPPGFTL